jgi:hypothetical protein
LETRWFAGASTSWLILLFVTVALLANAFACGALSGPHDRYGARIVWIATLTAAITLLQAIDSFAASRGKAHATAAP